MKGLRQKWMSKPIMERVRSVMPPLSATEQQALEAGNVWWDAELMSGKPDWSRLQQIAPRRWSSEEQAFLDGPVRELCRMIDDWHITYERRDLPDSIWQFLKVEQFFGLIIPKQYGGLGFSPSAHSEIVSRIATCSTSVAVTVMVPNSLGPAELLMEYGTKAQKEYYLPRLAKGEEIPCFGLTSPQAGSDASAMIDQGVVCYQEYQGKETLGIRLNWRKRYITLGPVATIIGLAFKLYDPDHILGEEENLGITVALVPTSTSGVEIGDRHYPALQAFQNGPTRGRDVFAPLDWIIGGKDQIGQGWKMLMAALAAGRSISLPSLSTAGVKLAACSTGAYCRIREQFGVPIGAFEGVQQRLAEIATTDYLLESALQITTGALDNGEKPAVISAILKAHSTYRFRAVINSAMDVHGGKTICDGPNNYLGNVYRAVPVAITVEGANILTRNLIIFGQGVIRCHPFLLGEIKALENPDTKAGLQQFDKLIYRHLWFQIGTLVRSWFHNWTGGRFASTPANAGTVAGHYRQLSRYSAALALLAEVTLLSLGGGLKRREFLSARLGDVLSELYLLSCMLQRYKNDGRPKEDKPLVDWNMDNGLALVQDRIHSILANYPSRPLAALLRFLLMPLGLTKGKPRDALTAQCAKLLLYPSATRNRLIDGVFLEHRQQGIGLVEEAFERISAVQPIRDKLAQQGCKTVQSGVEQGILSEKEARELTEADDAVLRAIEVDQFDASELGQERMVLHPRNTDPAERLQAIVG